MTVHRMTMTEYRVACFDRFDLVDARTKRVTRAATDDEARAALLAALHPTFPEKTLDDPEPALAFTWGPIEIAGTRYLVRAHRSRGASVSYFRESSLVTVQPAQHQCPYCDRGFRRVMGIHVGSQRKGMIPSVACERVVAVGQGAGGKAPFVAYVDGRALVNRDGIPRLFAAKKTAVRAARRHAQDVEHSFPERS